MKSYPEIYETYVIYCTTVGCEAPSFAEWMCIRAVLEGKSRDFNPQAQLESLRADGSTA